MLSILRNRLGVSINTLVRSFQSSAPVATEKFDHKRIPADDEGVQGEKIVDLDSALKSYVIIALKYFLLLLDKFIIDLLLFWL